MAADSLAKASTPEPVGPKPLWKHEGWTLPFYIEHIANDLREKRGMTESRAIATAVSAVKRWAAGSGKVDAGTRAAAQKAVAEWEALKAAAAATRAGKAASSAGKSSGKSTKAAHTRADGLALATPFDSALHPRAAAGASGGGQFVAVGQAKDKKSATAQKDKKAAANYQAAMTGDAATILKGLNDKDLTKLTAYAYSAHQSDPQVVKLRLAIAAEMGKRGYDVKKFGALGGGINSTKTLPKAAKKATTKKKTSTKKATTKTAQEPTVDSLALAGRHRAGEPQRYKHGWILVDGSASTPKHAKPDQFAEGAAKSKRPPLDRQHVQDVKDRLDELQKHAPEIARRQREHLNDLHKQGKLTSDRLRTAKNGLDRLISNHRKRAPSTDPGLVAVSHPAGSRVALATPLSDSQSGSSITVNDTSNAGVQNGSGSTPKPGRGKITAEKRRQGAKDGTALKDGSFLIENQQACIDAAHALPLANDTKQPMAAKHLAKRAKTLGMLGHPVVKGALKNHLKGAS